ncbi:MAG TPA: gliding motility protein GldN [Saprospiraceae bacterium]|nr:gliding motility protein GldN [Saprospiraceae bacterium]
MKLSFGHLIGFCLALIPSLGWSQNAETTVITESSDPVEDVYLDDVVRHTMIFENRVLPYEPLREADVPWDRKIWRVIDVREKINLPFTYPPLPLFTILSDGTQSGEIKVFKDEEFKEMMTPEEVMGKLMHTDTSLVFNPDTYEDEVVVTNSPVNPEDIKKYRVKEMWYFDKEASRMKVRILGIAPIKDEYDNNGLFKYALPLFWVYYPEAREVLARYQTYNEANDAAPGTWYDLFEERRFSSYIFKQSNVLDVWLSEYFIDANGEDMGVARLMESDRIQAELFNWEHDLWSY